MTLGQHSLFKQDSLTRARPLSPPHVNFVQIKWYQPGRLGRQGGAPTTTFTNLGLLGAIRHVSGVPSL